MYTSSIAESDGIGKDGAIIYEKRDRCWLLAAGTRTQTHTHRLPGTGTDRYLNKCIIVYMSSVQ